MMTHEELDQRARERAVAERLHTFKVAGQSLYLVRSRHTEPGAMHQVKTAGDTVTHCTCRGWAYRESCTHSAAVTRRLEREARTRRPVAEVQAVVETRTRRSQLYREA